MDNSYITSFIASIKNVCSTMMQLSVDFGEARARTDGAGSCDVSGIIGISGDVVGSVVVSFPMGSAQAVVALFSGRRLEPDDPDFADAIGEIVNMIVGGAKGNFRGKQRVSISCPSVIVGSNHVVSRQKGVPCIVIPCATDCGGMVLEIRIRESAPGTGTGTEGAGVSATQAAAGAR